MELIIAPMCLIVLTANCCLCPLKYRIAFDSSTEGIIEIGYTARFVCDEARFQSEIENV